MKRRPTAYRPGGSRSIPNRATWCFFSDTHCNHRLGLRPPEVILDDGDTDRASKESLWLWSVWLDEFIPAVRRAARGGPLYVAGVGDLIDLDIRARHLQLISRNAKTALDIAHDALYPLVRHADGFFVCRGTAAHTGESSQFEEMLAEALGARRRGPNFAAWSWLVESGGVLIEMAHHISTSRRASTRQGVAVREAVDTIVDYAAHDDRIPDLVVRGHGHKFEDSGDEHRARVIALPCWSFRPDEFAHRIGMGTRLPEIGGVIAICHDGRLEVEKLRYRPKRGAPLHL